MNTAKTPKFYRQRLILALLEQSGGSLSKMDFQKLLFLLHQEAGFQYYVFVPYRYGCYSYQAAEDIRTLELLGWLKTGAKDIALRQSADIANLLPSEQIDRLSQFYDTYRTLRGRELIKYVYERHPYYAIYSEMAGDLVDKKILLEIESRKPKKKETTLYTIGYEGITFEAYLNKLIQNNVCLLCDVRKNPASRKFGFSRRTLSRILPKFDIAYIHLPDLGIESGKRKKLLTDADYEALFKEYRNLLPRKNKFLTQVLGLLEKYQRIALTCFESEPEMCHRHCISDYLEKHEKARVVHL
ncbi:hypothetical protein BMS3Bbin08_00006 [bacterium BMS3Bbin08]|nr:hypothetical protein BMS3Bbin08_00006 [bacterium BMS3Bbin08]